MFSLKWMMPALMALTLSAGTTVFAHDNEGRGHGNNGNGDSQNQAPFWSGSPFSASDTGIGIKLGGSMLVPAQNLPADVLAFLPLPAGTDPLNAGGVTVRMAGTVGVILNGAAATQSYDVWFCRYSMATDRCTQLGTTQTDTYGQAHTSLTFLSPGTSSAGIFVITRAGATQYVSGFSIPAPANQGVALSLEGTVDTVTLSGGVGSFTLQGVSMVIVTDASTVFKGVADLSALTANSTVQVRGLLRADGTVLATMVKVDD